MGLCWNIKKVNKEKSCEPIDSQDLVFRDVYLNMDSISEIRP